MKSADHIVMVYPVYWYNMPAWAKNYFDQTFGHGFSMDFKTYEFGELKDKKFTVICVAGGYTVRPIEEPMNMQPSWIAKMTGMKYNGAHVYYGDQDAKRVDEIISKLK